MDAKALERGLEADRQRSAWMAAAQGGDRAAYDALLRDCIGTIRSTAQRQGVPADRIDDVLQETLLTIHRARHTYDPSRSFTAWLRTIAARRAIDSLRRHGRTGAREVHAPLAYENHADDAADPAEDAARTDRAGELRRLIADLPEGQRQAVEELALKEQSLAEAALATGRKTGALKVNLHRAIKTLRARMSGES